MIGKEFFDNTASPLQKGIETEQVELEQGKRVNGHPVSILLTSMVKYIVADKWLLLQVRHDLLSLF
jgi:hypothetical protein